MIAQMPVGDSGSLAEILIVIVLLALPAIWFIRRQISNSRADTAWAETLAAMPQHRRMVASKGWQAMTPEEIEAALAADFSQLERQAISTAEHDRFLASLIDANLMLDRTLDDLEEDTQQFRDLAERHALISAAHKEARTRFELFTGNSSK